MEIYFFSINFQKQTPPQSLLALLHFYLISISSQSNETTGLAGTLQHQDLYTKQMTQLLAEKRERDRLVENSDIYKC